MGLIGGRGDAEGSPVSNDDSTCSRASFTGGQRGSGGETRTPSAPSSHGAAPADDRIGRRARAREAIARTAELMLTQHYSPRSVETYLAWLRRLIRFHWPRDPAALDEQAVSVFLSALAIRGRVAAATQNQARSALAFYFRHVRKAPLAALEGVRGCE